MTKEKYAEMRKQMGTQEEAAEVLGVTRTTIAKRESGAWGISVEAGMAMKGAALGCRDKLLKD